MDRIDPFFISPGVLRGRAKARDELATAATTLAERYEHQRMAALYERATEDATARREVIVHDQLTRCVLTEDLASQPGFPSDRRSLKIPLIYPRRAEFVARTSS